MTPLAECQALTPEFPGQEYLSRDKRERSPRLLQLLVGLRLR